MERFTELGVTVDIYPESNTGMLYIPDYFVPNNILNAYSITFRTVTKWVLTKEMGETAAASAVDAVIYDTFTNNAVGAYLFGTPIIKFDPPILEEYTKNEYHNIRRRFTFTNLMSDGAPWIKQT